MHTLIQDVRYGLRTLLKQPTFTAVAIITLALGIGANTAIFSVVNAVILRPLPYADADRLVMLWGTTAKDGNQEQPFSFADFDDLHSQSKSFTNLTAVSPIWNFTLTGGGEPEPVQGLFVSHDLFDMLGAKPESGRAFLADDDRTGAPPVVIISNALWQRRFGGDRNVIGRPLIVSGNAATIIGIMPADFHFLEPAAELWVPLSQNQFATSARNVRLLSVVGKLNDAVALSQANAELSSIANQLASLYPDTNTGIGLRALALHEQVIGKVRSALLLLLGAVALILLIACANVVNLMLVRSANRSKEMAVRAAVGAGRMRLLRQLLTESITLSLLGGVAGALLATWGIKVLVALNPVQLPRYNKVAVNLTVLLFTLGASLITGVIFGLAPVWHMFKFDLNSVLKDGIRGTGDTAHHRISNTLVTVEIATAFVLLIGAGLLIRSFSRILEVNPGFETEHILTMQVGLPNSSYAEPQKRIAFSQQLEANLRAIPDVASVGIVTRLPLMSALNNVTTFLSIEGRQVQAGERPEIDFRRASTGYFETMGIPLRSGRLVTNQDVVNNTRSVVINEAMAKRFWPNEDPIGKRISTASSTGQQMQWQTIVGVVGNVRHLGLDTEPRPELYYHTNTSPPFGPVLVIRSKGDPKALISLARAKVRELDGDVPISNVNTMEQLVSQSIAQRRFGMFLLSSFAALALLLAAVGIYGVISYSVAQRTREIGVRMALGARTADVLRLILQKGLTLATVGLAIGLLGAFFVTRLMSRLLFQIAPTDGATFVLVSVGLIAVAFLACYLPARRATKVDPLVALRYE
ncbi:MAG TPA: ABC transporter permease [Pyrinomonadaceae bacterium]